MPSEEHRTLVIEALEPRLLLATVYGFIGSSTSSPAPQAPWVLTGNAGDRHMVEAGVSAIPPVSGYVDGLGSGVTTTFTLDGIPEHTELELQVGLRGKQTYPIGGGGPGEEDPPPEGVWRFDVWFGEHHRWWNTDGSGWGGDPWQFVHHDESFAVTVKGTWLSAGAAPGWYLESASVLRYTPTVFMYEVDTATEGASYTTGNEPGFVIWRSGDTNLSALDVNLSNALGTAAPGSDYTSLQSTATIPVGQSQVRVPVLPTDDVEREWTESVILELEDGDYYVPGTFSPVKVHIQDNDPVDIEADRLPEEAEDPEYNETNPGLYLVLNDDDDDQNGTIDGWDDPVPTFDDELEDVTLRFPDEYKVIGTQPNEQEAEVTLSLSSPRFRVWYSGELLLGGRDGPLSVVLDHASLGPEMTVQVEFVPEPPPEPSPPYSPYVAEVPFTPISGTLSLNASDVGPRGSGSVDVLGLVGVNAFVELTAMKGQFPVPLKDSEEAGPNAPGWYLPANYGDADTDGWSGQGWNPDGTPIDPRAPDLDLNPTFTPDKEDDEIAGAGSPYLFRLDLSASPNLPGTIKLKFPNDVRVWETTTKRDPGGGSSEVQSDVTEFSAQQIGAQAKSLYVEGISGSAKLKDILIRAEYTPQADEQVAEDRVEATVFEATAQLRFEGAVSPDNQLNPAAWDAGSALGFNQWRAGNGYPATPNTTGFHNNMEYQATISVAGTGALVQAGSIAFDIKRDVWSAAWTRAFGNWNEAAAGDKPPWTNDDPHEDDEDLTPSDANRIYQLDGPGMYNETVGGAADADERIRQVANLREWVKIKLYGILYSISDVSRWHSKASAMADPADTTKLIREPADQQKLDAGWIAMEHG